MFGNFHREKKKEISSGGSSDTHPPKINLFYLLTFFSVLESFPMVGIHSQWILWPKSVEQHIFSGSVGIEGIEGYERGLVTLASETGKTETLL